MKATRVAILLLAAAAAGAVALWPPRGGDLPGEVPGSGAPPAGGTPVPPAPTEPDPLALPPEMVAGERAHYAERVEEALRLHRAATDPEGRLAALRELAVAHQLYVRLGGGPGHLPFLARVAAEGETPEERQAAIIAVHSISTPEAVDFLLRFTRSPDPGVRFYAVEGLAWVRGAEAPRALEGLIAGMEDGAPRVREIAALCLGVVVRDPARAGDVLDRLRREEERGPAAAMVEAILRLDPVGGRIRIAGAMEDAPDGTRRLVGRILAERRRDR